MKNKSQVKRVLRRAAQIAGLLILFAVGGVWLPMQTAPTIFSALSLPTLSSGSDQQVSLRLDNRNADSGERLRLTASSPSVAVTITAVNYSCSFSGVTLLYVPTSGEQKRLPCDTVVQLPVQPEHTLQVVTKRLQPVYVPVTLSLTDGQRSRDLSIIIATAARNTDNQSRLSDQPTITLEQFFRQ